MIKVRIGGVPEHFNLAWHLAIEQKRFESKGIEIEWIDVPGGTGAMCSLLRNGEVDIAIGLTEGIISDIIAGNPSRIIQFFVNSPLRWGIYTAAGSDLHELSDIDGRKYAISRPKSGSHLMAYVNANKLGLKLSENQFIQVGGLEGARKSLKSGETDVFLWEKFTTKPFVDSGEFRMLGECATPWPCFVLAARNEFIFEHESQMIELVNTINLSCLLLQNNSAAPELIARRYGLKKADATQWFKELEYACSPEMKDGELNKITAELIRLNIINSAPNLADIYYRPHVIPTT